MAAKASQGVTTVVTGNCGVSLAPLRLVDRPPPPLDLIGEAGDYCYQRFADYLAALDNEPPALNAACLVGHSTLRVGAMPGLDRPAGDAELQQMRARLQEALDAGAIGMSTGLFYAPAFHAPPAEIEALAKLLRPAGALYTTHMRDEAEHVLDSLDESFAVGKAARVPVVISHHKTTGVANFGRTAETLPKIEAAMQGQEVGLDVYPYIASSTVLRTQRIEDALKVLITWSKGAPEQAGRELSDIARDWGVDILEAAARLQPAGAIYWMMDEADVQRVLAFEHSMIGSDGLPHDIASAPAAVGHLSARPRPLLARARPVRPRRGGAQDDRPVRRPLRPLRARRGARGRLCRPDGVRSRHGDRPRHLRRPDAAGHRHRACPCQRPPGVVGRQSHRRPPRPRPAPPANASRARLIIVPLRPSGGEGGAHAKAWEGEVGVGSRFDPHVTPTLSAPGGGEGVHL